MKRSLLLALWSTGVLGGPCKPSKPSETTIADGTPTESNHISLGLSSTYLDSTKTSQDGEHETSTGTSPLESGQISVSIPFSESGLNSHTQDAVSITIGLPEGSLTGTGSLLEPTSVGDSVPGTSSGDNDSEETSGAAGDSGSPSSPLTEGSSPTGTAEFPGTAINPGASGTATSPEDSGNPSGTASGFPEEPSGTLINSEVSGQPTRTADVPGEPGNTDVNTATDISNTIPGGVPGDASGTATVPEASGPSGTATVPGEPGTTDSPIGISEGVSDGPSGTATFPGEVDTTAPGGVPGGASDTSFSASDAIPTEALTDATTNGVPAASHDSTNTSGSPEETISAPGNPATGTEQGEATATQTGSGPGTDVAPTGTETSVAGPDQPAITGPGNTIPNDEGTLTQTNGDELTSTAAADATEDHSGAVTTDTNGVPTTLPGDQEQTTGSPEQSTGAPSDQNSDGNTNETSLAQEDSSAASTTDGNAAQPTTGEEAPTEPVPDNTDASSTGSSDVGNGATTTGAGAFETTNANVIPSTTMPGPSATANPVTTATSAGTDMPVVTEAPAGFNPTTVSGHPEWTSNTWITTTSDDSEPTVVPVLVGCKKCGGSGSGIILWGFPPVPNTWFQLPGLPKFSFPCIPPASGCTSTPVTDESGEDGEDDDDDDDKSSSTTCTDKATVTDCFVACTTYTGPAGESVTPECQTTCTRTHTGCSVTGTTTTSSAEACGPSGDSECTTCNVDLTANDDSEALKRRSLERRGGVDVKKNIAGCDWSNSAVGAPSFPAYPGGNLVLKNEATIVAQNSPLNQIKRWWRTTRNTDCVPSLNNIDESQFPKSGLKDVEGPSIDHVYEKSMLLDFWRFIIDPAATAVVGMTAGTPDKINCEDIKSYGGINSGTNLIQKVFDTYPGSAEVLMPNNAQFMDDFIGMDQWTNGNAKAQITDPEGTKTQADKKAGKLVKANTNVANAKKWIEDKMLFLEALAIGVEMFNVQEAKDALIRQNLRIYQALIDMDENAKNCMKDDAVINGVWSFAEKYKAFMADRFTGNQDYSMNQGVVYAKNKLLGALKTDVANAAKIKNIAAGDLSSWQKRLANMQDPNRAWEVSVTFVWAGPTTSKRDTDGLSCDRPNPSLTTESTVEPTTDATTFATSFRTSSDITTSDEVASTTEQVTTSQNPPLLTDLPTLTQQVPDTTISTPDGSSCAETATITNCNVGTGGGHGLGGAHGPPACIERETCNSWVNTRTTSTTPSPTPTLIKPDPGQNEKHCYNSGQKSNYEAITYAAESFCRDVVNDQVQGPVWSNYKLEGKKVPSTGYHFKLAFQVYEGCIWTANYDECMRYMKVPIDSCDCSAKGNKQGGWVENNCIMARIDPNSGI